MNGIKYSVAITTALALASSATSSRSNTNWSTVRLRSLAISLIRLRTLVRKSAGEGIVSSPKNHGPSFGSLVTNKLLLSVGIPNGVTVGRVAMNGDRDTGDDLRLVTHRTRTQATVSARNPTAHLC